MGCLFTNDRGRLRDDVEGRTWMAKWRGCRAASKDIDVRDHLLTHHRSQRMDLDMRWIMNPFRIQVLLVVLRKYYSRPVQGLFRSYLPVQSRYRAMKNWDVLDLHLLCQLTELFHTELFTGFQYSLLKITLKKCRIGRHVAVCTL
jgi:hypothetical protein